MTEPVKCKRCKQKAHVRNIYGCWYTYCPNHEDGLFDFLGLTREKSILAWNEVNGKPQSAAQLAACERRKAANAAKRKAQEQMSLGERIRAARD